MIANEFGEAASDELHRAALIAAGLALFVLTLVINAVARGSSCGAERGQRAARTPAAGMSGMSAVALPSRSARAAARADKLARGSDRAC